MREIYQFQQSSKFDGDPDNFIEAMTNVSMDYDAFITLFVMANKKGARLDPEVSAVMTEQKLEDAIDDDPSLMGKLQAAFNESMMMRADNTGSTKKKQKN